MRFWDNVAVFVATGGYVGKAPVAPGTFGTLIGLPLCYLLSFFRTSAAMGLTIAVIAGAVWAAHRAEAALGRHDPGCIVIDEIAGMAVTLLGLPFTPISAVTGFALFRVFDIAKPPPVRTLDRRVPGGLGVVADDVAAGILANLVLRAGIHLFT